jgi:serine/threonine-protein kinase Chk2
MEDPNLIAELFPADDDKGYGRDAIHMRENASRYIPPQGEARSDFRSRETTASLEDEEDRTPNETTHSRLHYPGLRLTFDTGPKAGPGLVLGTDLDCDIMLPQLRKISRRHCYLTFDGQRRLILRDFSRCGTIVTYDGQGGKKRRQFTWILSGHRAPEGTKRIVIEIHEDVKFQIIVSRHDQYPDLYNNNVDQFCLCALGFQSGSSTTALSGATTPPQDPIRLSQETLGTGAFAVVKRIWDVSTGTEYARKEPLDKTRFDQKMWEKESDIMSQISHVSQ